MVDYGKLSTYRDRDVFRDRHTTSHYTITATNPEFPWLLKHIHLAKLSGKLAGGLVNSRVGRLN